MNIKFSGLVMTSLLLTACAVQTPKHTSNENDPASSLSAMFGERIKPNMQEVEKHPLGSAKNPVRVSMPIGQRDYLSRLICENGESVSAFSRVGSTGIGPYGSMLDVYTVICDTNEGAVEHRVFLDMYHGSYVETRPAAGFKALKPKEKN